VRESSFFSETDRRIIGTANSRGDVVATVCPEDGYPNTTFEHRLTCFCPIGGQMARARRKTCGSQPCRALRKQFENHDDPEESLFPVERAKKSETAGGDQDLGARLRR